MRCTTRPSSVLVLTLVVVLALALAGCGGGGSASSSSTTAAKTQAASTTQAPSSTGLIPASLIARSDAICSRLGVKLDAADTAVPDRMTDPGLARLTALDQIAEQAALKELEAMAPTGAGSADWQRWISLKRRVIADLAQLEAKSARREEVGRRHWVLALDADKEKMIAAAKRLGLTVCSQVG